MLYYHIDVIGHFTQKCTFHVAEEVKIKIKIRDQMPLAGLVYFYEPLYEPYFYCLVLHV